MSASLRVGDLTVVDLFCGAGGISEGFRAAGFEIAYALDVDEDCCDTYRRNHPSVEVECASITDFTPKEFARRTGPVDIIVGGPSCQGFSTHGRRYRWAHEQDERNKLWRHMHGIVEELQPGAFMMENVPGLVYARDGSIGKDIVSNFKSLGYDVHWDIVLAANYGVPQLRRRVILIGVASGTPFDFPAPTHWGGWRRDTLDTWEPERIERKLLRHVPCWDAIGDLPTLGGGTGRPVARYTRKSASEYATLMRRGAPEKLHDHEAAPLAEQHLALISHVPPGGSWRDIPPHLLPDRYRGGMRRTDSTTLLGRLSKVRPAYTITTQFCNVTTGCFTHPVEDRALSVREGARLQSFPDKYQFDGSLHSRYRQVGNAVPPRLAQHFARAIAANLGAKGARRPTSVSASPGSTPNPPSTKTWKRMVNQARSATGPEKSLRLALDKLKVQYQTNERPLPDLRREADIVVRDVQVAAFVDGCFWHGCAEHTRPTKSNTKWWADKIATNRSRDLATNELLESAGWLVVRVWEHQDPKDAAQDIALAVRGRSAKKRPRPTQKRSSKSVVARPTRLKKPRARKARAGI